MSVVQTALTIVVWAVLIYLVYRHVIMRKKWRRAVPVRIKPFTFVMASPIAAQAWANKTDFSENDYRGMEVVDTTDNSARDQAIDIIALLIERGDDFSAIFQTALQRIVVEMKGGNFSVFYGELPDPSYIHAQNKDIARTLDRLISKSSGAIAVEII